MHYHNLPNDKVKEFVLAGNATITLQSGRTGVHYTYKIVRSDKNDQLYFVNMLHGQDNEQDYKYIGCYYADTEYFNPVKKYKELHVYSWPAGMRAIKYFFDNINKIPPKLFVFHEGKCGKCGRKLTTPESIERGFGPECYKDATDCNDCKNVYDCERTYLGGCTDGKIWSEYDDGKETEGQEDAN